MSSKPVLLALLGAGRSGQALANALVQFAGMQLVAVADPIPARRGQVVAQHAGAREFADFSELLAVGVYDAVVVALPNDLLVAAACASLKRGIHVLIESPVARTTKELKQLIRAANSSGKAVLPAMTRRFGASEVCAKAALMKQLVGEIRLVKLSHTRTRGVPAGTGWYQSPERSGGGALLDLGLPLIDLAMHLTASGPASRVLASRVLPSRVLPTRVFASRIKPTDEATSVEHAASATFQLDNAVVELSVAWQLNQPPQQQGVIARLHGTSGCLDVYTRDGAVLYRGFGTKNEHKLSEPKLSKLQHPKLAGLALMSKHFRDCMTGKTTPSPSLDDALRALTVVEACYKSMSK